MAMAILVLESLSRTVPSAWSHLCLVAPWHLAVVMDMSRPPALLSALAGPVPPVLRSIWKFARRSRIARATRPTATPKLASPSARAATPQMVIAHLAARNKLTSVVAPTLVPPTVIAARSRSTVTPSHPLGLKIPCNVKSRSTSSPSYPGTVSVVALSTRRSSASTVIWGMNMTSVIVGRTASAKRTRGTCGELCACDAMTAVRLWSLSNDRKYLINWSLGWFKTWNHIFFYEVNGFLFA